MSLMAAVKNFHFNSQYTEAEDEEPLLLFLKRKVDPMQVIKRDGRAVPFDRIKIVRAIEAAMKETDAGVDRD